MPIKFYQKASVQVAIITGIVVLLTTSTTIIHQRSSLIQDNKRLNRLAQDQTAEIQRLETLLTPFRTIALQEFAGPEAEALQKLAERISIIDATLTETKKDLDSTKKYLAYATNDRTLSDNQLIVLEKSLHELTGKVVVKSDLLDPEALSLAKQIETVIVKTKLSLIKQDLKDILALYAKGVVLIVNDIKHPPPHTRAIQKALLSIGIEAPASMVEAQNFPNDVLVIYICHK